MIGTALAALQSMIRTDSSSGATAAERADGWVNTFTGLGSSTYDRAAGTTFVPEMFLDTWTLASLYHFNDICRTIVSIFPQDALRRPWTWEGPDAPALTALTERLGLVAAIRRGATWGRLFGGAIGVMFIDDGQPPDQPVDRTRAHHIRCLDIYDRRSVIRRQRFAGAADMLYAHARTFEVYPQYGGSFTVHRDRCLVFGSVETGDYERESLGGWDASALQAPYNVIASYESGYLSLSNMLTDASQPVVTIKGLLDALSKKDGQALVAVRAQVMNLTRSIARALFLDADAGEKFDKVNTQFAGIPDAIDRLGSRLSVATRIPPMKLVGQAPAGLNATGEGETRNWYTEVESYQREEIAPHVAHIAALSFPGRGNRAVWPPLWTPTEKEQAEARKTDADADALYIDREVVSPEEVALTRSGPRDVHIDRGLRERMIAASRRGKASGPNSAPAMTGGAAEAAAKRIQLAPTDLATVVRVNEARASAGLPPIEGGDVTLAEWKARHAGVIAAAANAEEGDPLAHPAAHAPAAPPPTPPTQETK